MKLEITGRHFQIPDKFRALIQRRLGELPRLMGRSVDVLDAHVILSVEKHRCMAEIVLKGKTVNLAAIEECADMYASLKAALDKIERQVKKFKRRMIATKRQVSAAKAVAVAAVLPEASSDHQPRVIPERLASKKPKALEEAILDLNASRDHFVVFRDADSNRIQVIYKRKDGNYGLIQPE